MKQFISFTVCPANKQCVPGVYLSEHAILDKVSLILQNPEGSTDSHILANLRPVYKIF